MGRKIKICKKRETRKKFKLLERYRLFKAWYHHLRKEGIRLYGKNQSDVALHSRYNIINCAIWAFYNSGTHEIDGSYRNGQK